MIVTFEDIISCLACEFEGKNRTHKKKDNHVNSEYSNFLNNFNQVFANKDKKLHINIDELMLQVSQTIGCISCRASVEKLLRQLIPKNKNSYSLYV